MLFRGTMGSQYSGSVGGVVASHNRGGMYLRNRSVPVNTNTSAQQAQRSALGAAAIAWSSLSAAQRTGWGSYATATPVLNRIGDTVTLTGFNWFVASASFLSRLGLAVINDAPSSPGLSNLGVNPSGVFSASTGAIFATTDATANSGVLVGYSPIKSAGQLFVSGPYSIFTKSTMTATGFGPIPQAPAIGRYGLAGIGERRAMRVCAIDLEGRLSNVFEAIVSVLA